MAEITWGQGPFISEIKLPSNNTYVIKDAEAREKIETLGTPTHFLGESSTEITDGGTETPTISGWSGTVAGGDIVVYGNKEFIWSGGESGAHWIELGDLTGLKQLAYKDYVTVDKGNGKNVLGANATFSAASSSVTFGTHTTDGALGTGATFTLTNPDVAISTNTTGGPTVLTGKGTVTQPTINVTPTLSDIKATASGVTVGADGTASAVTGYAAVQTASFATSVSPTTSKLVTTSIVPTDGTESVSVVTNTSKKLATDTVANVTGNTDVTVPVLTSNTAKTLTFSIAGTDNETLVIGGDFSNNTFTTNSPVFGENTTASKITTTSKTVATGSLVATSEAGGSVIVDTITITPKTVAKAAADSVTVATGSVNTDATGSSIVTDVAVGATGTAITDLGTPTTASVLTGVQVTAQPTVTITDAASTDTNKYSVVTGIASATATGGDIAFSTGNLGATTSGGSVTVNDSDTVNAITALGAGTAAGQTISITNADSTKVALYDDLGNTTAHVNS